MESDLNNRIIEWFDLLRRRPLMIYTGNADYISLQLYIQGYLDGLGFLTSKKLNLDITRWYKRKIDKQMSVDYTNYIPSQFKDKSQDELKAILLDVTEAYFRENPDWHQS